MSSVRPITDYSGSKRPLQAGDALTVPSVKLKSGGVLSAGAAANPLVCAAVGGLDYNGSRCILPMAAATPLLANMVENEIWLITTGKLAARTSGFRWELALTDAGGGLWYCTLV